MASSYHLEKYDLNFPIAVRIYDLLDSASVGLVYVWNLNGINFNATI